MGCAAVGPWHEGGGWWITQSLFPFVLSILNLGRACLRLAGSSHEGFLYLGWSYLCDGFYKRCDMNVVLIL